MKSLFDSKGRAPCARVARFAAFNTTVNRRPLTHFRKELS